MTKNNRHQDVQLERIERACRVIDTAADNNHSVAALSEVASYSVFHFQRIFKAVTGVAVNAYVQRSRLRKASLRLAFEGDANILHIALDTGYESHEAFTRAFKRFFDQTPSEFRTKPDWRSWDQRLKLEPVIRKDHQMQVSIREFAETKVALLTHRGDPNKIYNTAGQFIKWRQQTGLSPVTTSKTFGVPNGDPSAMAMDAFEFSICGSVEKDIGPNDYGVQNGFIEGGKCAVVRHLGSHALMDPVIHALYGDWLPESGEEPDDRPLFFHYLNLAHQVAERDLMTDIYLPLK